MFTHTEFEGLIIFDPSVFNDERGHFFESFNSKKFEDYGLKYNWVQDNHSKSSRGVIRGLHLQTGEWGQAKLIRCLSGSILDVVVDLRPASFTFKKVFSIELSSDNKKSILIPNGFAHGFSIISDTAEVMYKCDNFYNKDSESGLIYNDVELNIDWKTDMAIVSEKDLLLPTLSEYLQFS